MKISNTYRKRSFNVVAVLGIGLLAIIGGCTSDVDDTQTNARIAELEVRLAQVESANSGIEQLKAQAQRNEDVNEIKNLTRAYGYYIDKKIWSETVELFSDDALVEISGRGVYKGKESVKNLFTNVIGRSEDGLADGELSNHMVLQGVVNVDPGGQTASGRWRAMIQIGMWQNVALWAEGPYEITYVKDNDVWKMSSMHWYGTFFTPYDQGWAKAAFPNNPSSDGEFPPDEPMSVDYDTYPGHYVPPFSYPNPVTGRIWTLEDTEKTSTKGMRADNMPNNPTPSGGLSPNPTPSGDR